MSRMRTFIDRLLNSRNIAPSLIATLVDDVSIPPPAPGEPTALRVDPTTGELLVKTSGGGGGGDATLAEQQAQTALLTTLAGTIGTATPNPTDPAVAVRNVQAMAVAPEVAPPGTDAQSIYLIQAGTGEPVLDINGDQRLGVVVVDPVGQGPGDRGRPWFVQGTSGGAEYELASRELQGAGLPADLTTGGGVKVGLVDAIPAGGNAIGTVGVTSLPGNPAQDRTTAAAPSAVRLSDGSNFLSVALDTTVTAVKGVLDTIYTRLADGSQVSVAKGPIAPGAAVGSEKPVLFGGTDGANAQLVNVDSTGAVRLQSGGIPGSTAPSRATQIGGTDGTNLRALAVINTAPTTEYGAVTRNIPSGVQTVDIQTVSRTATGAVSAAQNGTIKSSPGKLLYLRAESNSAGTFYLQLHDASSTGGIGAGTIVGLGFVLSGSGDEIQFAIDGAPIEFTTGISWALSTTKNTYTAAAGKAAFVEARWR